VTEDIASASADVVIMKGFQVFATVRTTNTSRRLSLSPAARSRFTEIYVAPYTDEELSEVLKFELKRVGKEASDVIYISHVLLRVRYTDHL
jgi:midasin (ATPase involved in ribosome maturation)